MKLVTSQQMRALDQAAIQQHGIASLTLMERAGSGVADVAEKYAAKRRGAIVVVCGRGNNGGDGLVAARLLIERGHDVVVFVAGRSTDLSADARANWELLPQRTRHIHEITSEADLAPHHPVFVSASVILDALFGTGLSRELSGLAAYLVEYMNAVKRPIVAVDIPSGLSADTGKPLGVAVRASRTVTFGRPKLGLYIGESVDCVGKVEIVDIGIPVEEVKKLKTPYHLTDPRVVRAYLKKRKPTDHKGNFGHVALVAGSGEKLGAGYLASLAALKVGAGLVTYYLPETSFEKFDARYSEIMCSSVPDRSRKHFHPDGVNAVVDDFARKNVLAIGPAIGTHDETRAFERDLIALTNMPMVIDADGLNNLDLKQIVTKKVPAVLTPHPAEFGRLVGMKTDDVQRDRLEQSRKLARSNHVICVLKGYRTITALPNGAAYINPTGGPAMASAGMGDALTGAIAGFIAQGIDPAMAAVIGVYCHGLAGDMAAREIGDRGVVASDVIKRLPAAIREATEKE